MTNLAVAMQSTTPLRDTAGIATAAWIDAGLTLTIDHNKAKRAQERVMKKINTKFEEDLDKGGISCIFFDGRCDQKVLCKAEENGKMYPGIIKEEHYTVFMVPEGKYIWHLLKAKLVIRKLILK